MIDHFVLYMLMVASNKRSNFPYVLLVRNVTEQVPLLLNEWALPFGNFGFFNQHILTPGNSSRKYYLFRKTCSMLVHNFMEFKPKMISSLMEESGGSRHFSYLCYLERKLPRNWEFFVMKSLKQYFQHQILTSASVIISQGESYFTLIRSFSRKANMPLGDLFQQALILKSPLLHQLPSIRKIIIPGFYIIPPM